MDTEVTNPDDMPAAAAAWEEIKRRLEAIDAGHAKLIPWEEARRRIFTDADNGAFTRE